MDDINPIDLYVGERLRDRRKKSNFSMQNLADRIGVSMQQVQKYEKGLTRIAASQLYEIAEVLGVVPGFFFEGLSKQNHINELSNKDTITDRRKPLNVMVVEDSPADELVLRRALDESGCPSNLYFVHDGQQAINALYGDIAYNDFPRPDIILLDLCIPKISGIDVLKNIKRNRKFSDIPIIIVTNNVNAHEMLKIYKNQAAGYVCKNFNYESFAENIRYLVNYWAKVVALPNTSTVV